MTNNSLKVNDHFTINDLRTTRDRYTTIGHPNGKNMSDWRAVLVDFNGIDSHLYGVVQEMKNNRSIYMALDKGMLNMSPSSSTSTTSSKETHKSSAPASSRPSKKRRKKSPAGHTCVTCSLNIFITGSGLFHCDQCGKMFTSKQKLRKHIMVVHEKKRNFACAYCDKFFSSNSNVMTHEGRVHTGILPYKCEQCDKMFSRKSLLEKHFKNIHLKGILNESLDSLIIF